MHKTGFGHFLKFGTSDGLDIVYYDSTKCFPAFDNITRTHAHPVEGSCDANSGLLLPTLEPIEGWGNPTDRRYPEVVHEEN